VSSHRLATPVGWTQVSNYPATDENDPVVTGESAYSNLFHPDLVLASDGVPYPTPPMSSQQQNSTTARDAIEQYLRKNGGWHEVNPIAVSTGYSHNHILRTGTEMADDTNSPVERRKNTGKPVIGYRFNGASEVPGSDRQAYIRYIRMYGNGVHGKLKAKSLSDLQDILRGIADSTVVFDFKVEFRIP
jgi:hypothetical protein